AIQACSGSVKAEGSDIVFVFNLERLTAITPFAWDAGRFFSADSSCVSATGCPLSVTVPVTGADFRDSPHPMAVRSSSSGTSRRGSI
ncbi:MAG: hypothetical protein ACK56X_15245, partial [Planctomyces sp.]